MKRITAVFCLILFVLLQQSIYSQGLEDEKDTALLDMIFVEGGKFIMGTSEGEEAEKPMHTIEISSFFISKYEITQSLYKKITSKNPSLESRGKGKIYPVNSVNWYEAILFCNLLSEYEGFDPVYAIDGTSVDCNWDKNGYRLLTEAEWEYAAQGGKKK